MKVVLPLLFTILLASPILISTAREEQPLNVLFISIDDLRTELGCYGTQAITPNMDRLARQGALFNRHYVQVPTCGASRYALLAGLRPTKPVHLTNAAIEKELSDRPEGSLPETFIHHLRKEGYHTLGIGKISHSADGLLYGYTEPMSTKRELPHSWSELLFNPGKWKTGWNAFFGYANGENRQSRNRQVKPYENAAVADTNYVDGLTADLAISKLKELRNQKKPFFLGVGFFKPHLPFNAPRKYWDLYDPEQLVLSPNPDIPENAHTESLHNSGEFNQYALGEEKASLAQPLSEAYSRKLKQAYLASVSYIDAQVGKLLKELDRLGLSENTLVVLWGDHGWHLGDQRVWGKHTLFESALKSTLIIRSPHKAHRERKIQTIVETVDLYPTILELCGLTPQQGLDGQSLVPLLSGKSEGFEETAYSYYRNGVSLRTEDYRLSCYYGASNKTYELYDLKKDPYETRNVADKNTEILRELTPLLEKGIGDPSIYNPD